MTETTLSALAACELTTDQVAKARRYLSATRDLLLDSVAGLSSAQWTFRPDAETWSIADNLEHLVMIETRVHAIIRNIANAPPAPLGLNPVEMDELIVNEVPKRANKVKAPLPVCPAGRWAPSEAVQLFLEGREQTIQLADAPMLRGRVMPHPVFGYWDGYQWLLATAAHNARHRNQIREVKEHPEFPPSNVTSPS